MEHKRRAFFRVERVSEVLDIRALFEGLGRRVIHWELLQGAAGNGGVAMVIWEPKPKEVVQ